MGETGFESDVLGSRVVEQLFFLLISLVVVVHLLSHVELFATPWTTACQASDPIDCSTPGFPVLHHLPEFAQAHVH